MEKIIKAAVERGASDLHIKAGDVFRARINGKLVPLTKQRLTPDQTRAIALKLISSDEDRSKIDRLRDFDCSWGMPGVGRFRVNVLRQRSSFMIVMRVIPFTVPTIESLRLPAVLAQIAESDRGLVLVTGVSGSGKSSTVAAMVHHINRTQHKHVVTIENPIEFLHRDLSCSVTQREVGVDTENLTIGLRAALRQDPDVVILGEIADADTIDTAIKAAETGHLVIATMPTPGVTATIDRILTTLPREEREIGRMRLSEALRAIISQQLLPQKDEKGRVAAVEVLIATAGVREASRTPRASATCGNTWPRAGSSSARRPSSSTWPSWWRPDSSPRKPPRPRSRRAHPVHLPQEGQAGRVRLTSMAPALHDTMRDSSPHRARPAHPAPRRRVSSSRRTSRRWASGSSGSASRSPRRRLWRCPCFGAGLGALGLLLFPRAQRAGDARLDRAPAARRGPRAARCLGRRHRTRLGAGRWAAPRRCQSHRDPRHAARRALDRGAPGHEGAGAIHGGEARRRLDPHHCPSSARRACGHPTSGARPAPCGSDRSVPGASRRAHWRAAAGSGGARPAPVTTAPAWPGPWPRRKD